MADSKESADKPHRICGHRKPNSGQFGSKYIIYCRLDAGHVEPSHASGASSWNSDGSDEHVCGAINPGYGRGVECEEASGHDGDHSHYGYQRWPPAPAISKESAAGQYRKKPVVIEAVRWFKHGDGPFKPHTAPIGIANPSPRDVDEYTNYLAQKTPVVGPWCHLLNQEHETLCAVCAVRLGDHGYVPTLEAAHRVCPGDWIICGVKGEYYACKPDIFALSYEPAVPSPVSIERDANEQWRAYVAGWLDGEASGSADATMGYELRRAKAEARANDYADAHAQPIEREVGTEAKQEAAPYTIAETYSYGDHRPFCGRCEAKRILRKLFWRGNAGWKCPECDPSAPSSSVSDTLPFNDTVILTCQCGRAVYQDCLDGRLRNASIGDHLGEDDGHSHVCTGLSVSDTLTATDGISPEDDEILRGIVERHSPTWLSDRIAELRARNGERINDPRKDPPSNTPTDTERLRFNRQALIDARVFKQTRLIAGNWVPKWYIGDRDSSPEFSSADEALDALWAASRSSGEAQ